MNSSGNPNYSILGDGAVTYPAQQFAQESGTGIFRELYPDTTSSTGTSTAWAVATKGVKRLRVTRDGGDLYGSWNIPSGTSGSLDLEDGSASAPSLSFTSEPTLGIYKDGTQSLGIASNGVNVGDFKTDGLHLPGSAFATNYFDAGTNHSGISSGVGATNVLVNGASTASFTSTTFRTQNPIFLPDGSATSPALTFSSGTSTGLYTGASNVINVVQNSTRIGQFDSKGLSLANSLTFDGTPAGVLSCDGKGSVIIKSGTNPILTTSSTGVTSSQVLYLPQDTVAGASLNFIGSDIAGISSDGAGKVLLFGAGPTLLQLNNNVINTISDQIQGKPGTSGSPSYAFHGLPTLGIYQNNTQSIGLSSSVGVIGTFGTDGNTLNQSLQVNSTINATGIISQPQYVITNSGSTFVQGLTANANNLVAFPIAADVLTNWATRLVATTFIAPITGVYDCRASLCFNGVATATTLKVFWVKNDSSPGMGSTYYGLVGLGTTAIVDYTLISSSLIKCTAGDVLRIYAYTTATVSIGNATDNSRCCSVQIDWRHP